MPEDSEATGETRNSERRERNKNERRWLLDPSLTFDVIQSIDTEQHFSAFELLLVLCEHRFDAWLLERFDEFVRIDADGEGAQLRRDALVGQHVVAMRRTEDALAAFLEVARVVTRVEADQIGSQHSVEQLFASGKHAIDLVGGERSVLETKSKQRRGCEQKQRKCFASEAEHAMRVLTKKNPILMVGCLARSSDGSSIRW